MLEESKEINSDTVFITEAARPRAYKNHINKGHEL